MDTLLFTHSLTRWIVVLFLFLSIFAAFRGYFRNLAFDQKSNFLRHWTATFAHIQLIIGILLATKSPYFNYFWENISDVWENTDAVFYGLFHPLVMFISIVLLTIGSAKAKRAVKDRDKFKTMLLWYSIVAVLIFIAIPWPFSPFTNRPLIPSL